MTSTPRIDSIETLHSAEAVLFDDTLSYESCVPAAFVPGSGEGRPDHAQSLLHSLELIEDRGRDDGQGERDELSLYNQRVEAKLDLNLLLLGHLLEQGATHLNVRTVRWSIRGARLEDSRATGALIGSAGVLQLQPCDWLPETLELPARVFAVEPGQWVWVRFPGFAPNLNDALERHLFRQHRKQIALLRHAADKQ